MSMDNEISNISQWLITNMVMKYCTSLIHLKESIQHIFFLHRSKWLTIFALVERGQPLVGVQGQFAQLVDYSLTLWAGCQQTPNPSIPQVLHVSSVRSQGSRWGSAEDVVTGCSSLQFLQKTKSVYTQVKKKINSKKLWKALGPISAGCVLVILENIIEMELLGMI